MINKRPNLFIIGAPKCGTTALCSYLESNDEICFSKPKEAKFFHTDFSKNHRLFFTEKEYLKIFPKINEKTKFIAEGTVWYLFSDIAIQNILKFNADAKFIVMVRNPIDLAYSLHSQLLYGGDENIESFYDAWKLQKKRFEGKNIPPFCRDSKSLQYGEIAKLGGQVERLFSLVNKENIHIITFEDFKDHTKTVYNDVLKFLNVEEDNRSNFPKINENKKIRNKVLAQLIYFFAFLKRSLGISRSFRIWHLLQPLIVKKNEREKLDKKFRDELKAFFKDDIILLSKLISKDLRHWYE